jgi:hypothetical protein
LFWATIWMQFIPLEQSPPWFYLTRSLAYSRHPSAYLIYFAHFRLFYWFLLLSNQLLCRFLQSFALTIWIVFSTDFIICFSFDIWFSTHFQVAYQWTCLSLKTIFNIHFSPTFLKLAELDPELDLAWCRCLDDLSMNYHKLMTEPTNFAQTLPFFIEKILEFDFKVFIQGWRHTLINDDCYFLYHLDWAFD